MRQSDVASWLMKMIPRWLITVVIALSAVSCQASQSEESNSDKAIQQALSWVYEHPASFADGGFIGMSEELIMFHVLGENTEDASRKETYVREVEKRLDLLSSENDLTVQPLEYTMLLALAEITDELGLREFSFRRVIDDQLISDHLLCPPHTTTCIWNMVYLERMGYTPPKSPEELMPQSTLSKEVRHRLLYQHVKSQFDPMHIEPISITTYDLTHEIFALTDFGELPPPPIVIENRTFFAELFDHVIQWATSAQHIDVLAEAIMCVMILDLEDVSSLQRGVEFIISNQEEDGSFGITNPGRQNIYRHGILVSIMALSMVEGSE